MSDLQGTSPIPNPDAKSPSATSKDASAPEVVDCRFFLTTGCTKGSSCPFRHKEEVKKVNILCSKFLRGGCHDPDCKFIHLHCLPSVSSSRPHYKHQQPASQAPTQKICYYFTHGGCKNGNNCPYLHVKSTNSAIEEKINELMSMISNNGMASAPAQKRTAPTLQPSKRINIVDGENSDPLGYSEPTAHDSIEARGARARHSMKQMIEGHLAKRGPKPKTEHAPSINDFVVRSRAEILAAQKGEQSSSSAPATQVAQPVQPVQPVQPQNTEVAADLIDDDDDDDAAYMDELAKMDQLLGSTKS